DIGTGSRTLFAIIAAEVLGLQVTDINSNIGNSTFPPGQPSGGSQTTPSMCPPAYVAVQEARDELFKKIAGRLNAPPENLSLANGQVLVNGQPRIDWKTACGRMGMMPINVTAKHPGPAAGLNSPGVAGAQFAEVTVDVETGLVKLTKFLAVQDSGLILNLL